MAKVIFTAEQLKSVYGTPQAQTTQPVEQPKKDGLLKNIAKDVAGTLLVKPAARATEALIRTAAPESQLAKGYEAMNAEGGQKIASIDVSQKAFGEGGGRQLAGETLQTASYLFPYGKAAKAVGTATGSKLAGNIASGATGGYTADVGFGLADQNQTMKEAITPGVGTAIGAAIPTIGPALRATGRAVAKTGSLVEQAIIPNSAKEAQILQTYKANNPFMKRVADVLKGTEKAPTTAGKTVVSKGLMGTKSGIGVQAKRASQTLWNDVISPKLKASGQAVDLEGFFSKVQDDIIAGNPELSRQKSLLEALDAVKEDYTGINAVSLEKLQKLKEGWAKFVPDKAYKGKPIAGAFADVRNQLADEARQTIYSQLGDDVKQAYFDYGNLLGLQEYGQTAMTGAKLKGGAGSFVQEIFSQAVTPVATIGGQAVYKLGKGIEFIGNLGAKNLGEALGIKGGLQFPGDKAVDDISASVNQAKKNLKNPTNAQGGFINLSGKSDDLIQEAKKYKSVEEFVEFNTPKVYRGQSVGEKGIPREGLSTSFDFNQANKYARARGLGAEKQTYYLNLNAKKISLEDVPNEVRGLEEGSDFAGKAAIWARKNGYDILDMSKGNEAEMRILTEKAFTTEAKTKSQLEDIWKKANAGTKVEPLIAEAKKYKSAEDFANKAPSKVIDGLRNQGIRGAEQRMAFWEKATKGMDKTPVIDSMNPTGVVFVDYTPEARMNAKLADNITTLDKTMGKSPDDMITIYRGAPKNQKSIVGGDFVTTNYDVAKSYTDKGNVLSKRVKLSDVLDDLEDPLGEEYIYRPKSHFNSGATPKAISTITAFEKSKPIEKIGKFQLGTFGKNAYERKSNLKDRFDIRELKETIENIKDRYRASSNKKSYRYDNTIHIAYMPNNEVRAIYTRKNSNGLDEIINWHKISDKKYLNSIQKNGAPGGTRTPKSSR